MWSRLSLWVMQQDAAYRVDGRDGWTFHLADATGAPFGWKGIDYTGGIAASAPSYLDVELPPGTYVAWANRGSGDQAEDTYRAVVAVNDEPQLVVRLLPRRPIKPCPDPHEPEPEESCRLEIVSARGDKVRDERPGRITVNGTAQGCSRVVVEIDGDGISVTDTVDVDAVGDWTAMFRSEGEFACDQVVIVTVRCQNDKRCLTRRELRIDCERPARKQPPRERQA